MKQRVRARGQGLLEYGLIIIAVALTVIVLIFFFGAQVASMFTRSRASIR